jgi:hypothetical protein
MPNPGQIILEGEVCWTAHTHAAHGPMEHLDPQELRAKLRCSFLMAYIYFTKFSSLLLTLALCVALSKR